MDKSARRSVTDRQITYHKNNNGTGAADLALTMLAYQAVRAQGRGIEIAI